MRVEAIVRRHVGFGAICDVGTSRIPAIIRRAEIDWDPTKQNVTEIPEGSTFDAVVLGFEDDWRELIISRKAAEPSLFDRFVAVHRVGEIVHGTVHKLAPTVAVIRLDGGLEGEVPWTLVPDSPQRHEELIADRQLVEGDQVQVAIERYDPASRRVVLNLKAAVQRSESSRRAWLSKVREGIKSLPNTDRLVRPTKRLQIRKPRQRLHVLIVENEEDILLPLATSLSDRTHVVLTAAGVSQARAEIATTKQLDVAIVDLQLAGASGAPLLDELRQAFPDIRLIVFSGNTPRLEDVGLREDVSVLVKPIEPAYLIDQIEGMRTSRVVERVWQIDEAVSTLAQLDHRSTDSLGSETRDSIDDYLSSLIEPFEEARVAVLTYLRSTNEIRCLRSIGVPANVFDRFSSSLRYSFAGDVLSGNDAGVFRQDARQLQVNLSTSTTDPFVNLLRELRSERVYAVPLHVESHSDSMGVFVFFPEGCTYIPQESIRQFQHQATAMALAIERATLDAQLLRYQRALSAGSLLLGMTHEIRNEVQALKSRAYQLNELFSADLSQQGTRSSAQECLTSFTTHLDHLKSTFESLLGLTRSRSAEKRSIGLLVRDVIDQCGASAEQADITIVLDEVAEDVATQAVSLALYQAVMNLVLNAIQHVRAFRKLDGFVKLSLVKEDTDAGESITITIEDNAFGLDWNNRDRIFDMFFTTRRDGSGMGLHVSRLIVETLGGTLEVASSYKYLGTTMLLRLPLEAE